MVFMSLFLRELGFLLTQEVWLGLIGQKEPCDSSASSEQEYETLIKFSPEEAGPGPPGGSSC